MKYETLKRGNLIYYITESAVVVKLGLQYVSYNIYNSPKRSDLADFKKKLKASRPDQYTTATEQMDLAQKCKLVGAGITKPSWITE